MGCWTETCFVTRTPVFAGDAAAMIVLTGSGVRHGVLGMFNWPPHRGCSRIELGAYNGYGWTEGAEDSADRGDAAERSVFVHREVWDRLADRPVHKSSLEDVNLYRNIAAGSPEVAKTLDPDIADWSSRPPAYWDRLRQWVAVLGFCAKCRIDPRCGLAFKGSQDDDRESFGLLMRLTVLEFENWVTLHTEED